MTFLLPHLQLNNSLLLTLQLLHLSHNLQLMCTRTSYHPSM